MCQDSNKNTQTPFPVRKSLRLGDYDYTGAGAYFITICAHNHCCHFGKLNEGKMQLNQIGRIVEDCWTAIPSHLPDIDMDEYIVMPNHFHGIIWIRDNDGRARHASPLHLASSLHAIKGVAPKSINAAIASFKSASTRLIRQATSDPSFLVWQRNYYEHVVRDEASLNLTREYIIENPSKWAEDPENIANVNSRISSVGARHASPAKSSQRHGRFGKGGLDA